MSKAPSIHLRFPDDKQHTEVVDEAEADGRSLNNYLLRLIEASPDRKRKAKAKK